MIEQFKEMEMRNSGVIYSSTLEQIKKLYEADPDRAGELAISAIELVLCGDVSSDDMMVSLLLEPMRKINENNQVRYEAKIEGAKAKKMVDMRLDKIAELVNAGLKQKEIGERLGMSQQTVSYRLGLIKTNYPELLNRSTNKNTNNLNTVQTVYKNTNKNVCTEISEEKTEVAEPKKNYFDF